MTHALDLPEIRLRIEWYLDAAQVIVCSRVCKSWYNYFMPLVWMTLHLGFTTPPFQFTSLDNHLEVRHRVFSIDTPKLQFNYQIDHLLYPLTRALVLTHSELSREEIMEILRTKGPWIRSLTYHDHVSKDQFSLGRACNRLESLAIQNCLPWNDEYAREYWNSCKALIKQNRECLRSLSLQKMTSLCDKKPPPGEPHWSPIMNCANHMNLRELVLVECTIWGGHLKTFWKICERLEVLTMENTTVDISRLPQNNNRDHNGDYDHNSNSTEDFSFSKVRFPRLLELTLRNMTSIKVQRLLGLIIAECPAITSLYWHMGIIDYSLIFNKFCGFLEAGTWPHLEALNLRFWYGDVQDREYMRILQSTKSFKKLALHVGTLTQPSFDLLSARHFMTLRELNLVPRNAPGKWVQEILASCPNLEVLRAHQLCPKEVVEDKRSWVCLRMTEFRVYIHTEKPDVPGQPFAEEAVVECRAMFTQLAQLTKLLILGIGSSQSNAIVPQSITLPLQRSMGLELLSSLTKLEHINFGKDQNITMGDVLWMVEHWKQLKVVDGGLMNSEWQQDGMYRNRYVNDFKLSRVMNAHGIETPRSRYRNEYLDEEISIA